MALRPVYRLAWAKLPIWERSIVCAVGAAFEVALRATTKLHENG